MIKSSIIEKAHPVLAEVIRTTKLNEIRGPFQIEGWNVLVRVNSRKLATYDENREDEICRELFSLYIKKKSEELMESWNSKFNHKATEINH